MELELNHFFNKSVYIYQCKHFVKVSMDTILLSASVNLTFFKNKKINVLDVGSGIGGGDILLAKRSELIDITGIEIQNDLIDIANMNVKQNLMQDRINFINQNIKDCKVLKKDGFNWVITNPPFHFGSTSPFFNKSLSYTETSITLDDWILFCIKNVCNLGYFSIIHKASRLDDIIFILKKIHCGNINIFPVFTKDSDLKAKRIIVTAQKGSKSETSLYKEISKEKLQKILQNPIDIYSN